MGLCNISKDYRKNAYTLVDNVFFERYLLAADPIDTKVYLYGLYLACTGQNTDMDTFALRLKLDTGRIVQAWRYWEKQGIISIDCEQPYSVSYLNVKEPLPKAAKINMSKYEVFIKEATRLFPEKVLSPGELYAYIELMKDANMEINAMLLIMGYCINLKGDSVSTPYILKVADNWAANGIRTEKEADEYIKQLECNSAAIRDILAALNIKRVSDMDDRQLYLKWTAMGYSQDVLLLVARQAKNKGIKKLDALLEELYAAKAIKAQEAEEFFKQKKKLKDTAVEVVKGIGGYYADLDAVIETYILPWIQKGFEKESLKLLAHFCLISNVKTLEGMNRIIEKFFKMGLLTPSQITDYIDERISIDDKIREVLQEGGGGIIVNNTDRELYRVWIKEWGFSHAVVLEVARGERGKSFVMSAINRALARLKDQSLYTDKEIIQKYKEDLAAPAKQPKSKKSVGQSEYSKEQLDSIFYDIAAADIDKAEL